MVSTKSWLLLTSLLINNLTHCALWACQVVPVVKNPPANAGGIRDTGSIPGLGRFLEQEMAIHPVFLPGKSHGQKTLECYSPKGHQESNTTKCLSMHVCTHSDYIYLLLDSLQVMFRMFSIIKPISVNIDNMHTYMCKYNDMYLHFLIIISGYISTKDISGYLHLNVNIC